MNRLEQPMNEKVFEVSPMDAAIISFRRVLYGVQTDYSAVQHSIRTIARQRGKSFFLNPERGDKGAEIICSANAYEAAIKFADEATTVAEISGNRGAAKSMRDFSWGIFYEYLDARERDYR